jgi:hypothetical protein
MRELNKIDWKTFKARNENVILDSQMNIKTATEVIELCNREIAKFPDEIKEEVK